MATLPLLKLPQNAILGVLRTMKAIDLVFISTLSQSTKNLVKSLNIKSRGLDVWIEDEVVLKLDLNGRPHDLRLVFCYQKRRNGRVDVNRPRAVFAYELLRNGQRRRLHSQPQYWMDHLKYLFSFPRIFKLEFSQEACHFDLDSVGRTFGDFETLVLSSDFSTQFQNQIFQVFRSVKHLDLQDTQNPQIFIQNVDSLSLENDFEETSVLITDDVMTINAKSFNIEKLALAEKDINRILKLWIKGAFPRWEKFYLTFDKEICESKVLKGIKYQCSPLEQRFKASFEKDVDEVDGGFDIWRKDGIRATIKVNENILRMYIWHSHCIVHH